MNECERAEMEKGWKGWKGRWRQDDWNLAPPQLSGGNLCSLTQVGRPLLEARKYLSDYGQGGSTFRPSTLIISPGPLTYTAKPQPLGPGSDLLGELKGN